MGKFDIAAVQLAFGNPKTIKRFRESTYIDSDGSVRHHYDIGTAWKLFTDGSVDSQFGNLKHWQWEFHECHSADREPICT